MAVEARTRRRHAERRGRYCEYIAALYLLAKGYRILAMRHKTPMGEIDLIAARGRLIIFVEVKARASVEKAIDAVGFSSQHRIRAASDLWLARRKNASSLSQRYDIIAVLPWRIPKHFIDAF